MIKLLFQILVCEQTIVKANHSYLSLDDMLNMISLKQKLSIFLGVWKRGEAAHEPVAVQGLFT